MRYELLRLWAAAEGGASRKAVVFVTHSVQEAVVLADRVLVLSRRPGRLLADLPIPLRRPRLEEDERSAPFLDAVAAVRRVLRQDRPEWVAR
jgi:NitT/TauT family transport system ATP-binding protein